MGKDPKKPTREPEFVNDVAVTYGTKPGSGIVNPDGTRNNKKTGYWKWTGSDWVKIRQKEYTTLLKNQNYFKNPYGESSIETDQTVTSGSIRYPADVASGGDSAYVLFSFYDYTPPFGKKKAFTSGLRVKKGNSGDTFVTKGQEFVNESLTTYNRGGVLTADYEPNALPQLMLYMPSDIQDAYKADWEGKAFGSTAAGILSSAGAEGTKNKLKTLLKAGNRALAAVPVNAAAATITNLAKGITGDQISESDVFSGISGVIKNPNVEILFQKMNLRTFDLTFKMSAFSPEESKNIRTIVQTFKKAMLPSYDLGDRKVFGFEKNDNSFSQQDDPALNASFIAVPSVCHVQFMHGGSRNPYVPKYKMCAITDVGISYTPDGNYAVFQGGAPVATELKISFMETKLVFSEDIQDQRIELDKNNNPVQQQVIGGGY